MYSTATHGHWDYTTYIRSCVISHCRGQHGRHKNITQITALILPYFVLTADMRLVSAGVRARRAAEPSEPEPEEATEPVHHEHSHTEHHEHSHAEHQDYNHMKNKFMNELGRLPSKPRVEFTRI